MFSTEIVRDTLSVFSLLHLRETVYYLHEIITYSQISMLTKRLNVTFLTQIMKWKTPEHLNSNKWFHL